MTSMRAADLARLRTRLILLGASPTVAGQLYEAVEADGVLSTSIDAGSQLVAHDQHPLAATVHRRSLVRLITWPLTGSTPPQLQKLPAAPRRGPAADRPSLAASERVRFFDHMMVIADSADASTSPLLRRQAAYLLGFDDRSISTDWLNREHQRSLRKSVADGDVRAGITARSAAVALALRGDPEPVRGFINRTLSSQTQATANLNYWAYWLGEIPDSVADDSALASDEMHAWPGTKLAAHLAHYLQAPGVAELNIHSLWHLVLARPHLLAPQSDLLDRVEVSVEDALDGEFVGSARDTLANLRCAVQLARR